jgi:hypothetical protein
LESYSPDKHENYTKMELSTDISIVYVVNVKWSGAWRTCYSLYIFENFEDVIQFFENYYGCEHDDDCDLCKKLDGRERCQLHAIGVFAEARELAFDGSIISYKTIKVTDQYCKRKRTKN